MASKGTSAIMRGTDLKDADPFVKMSITAILSGMASKAAGGDFVQGAMSAMVVYLYNDKGFKQSMGELWHKLTDGTIGNSISTAVSKGGSASAKMLPKTIKFMMFSYDSPQRQIDYSVVMNHALKGAKGFIVAYRNVRDNAPWYIRYFLAYSLTRIEFGATKWLDGNSITGIWYSAFSGTAMDTLPTDPISATSWIGSKISGYSPEWF